MEITTNRIEGGQGVALKEENDAVNANGKNNFAVLDEREKTLHVFLRWSGADTRFHFLASDYKSIILDALEEKLKRCEKEYELWSPEGMYAELVGRQPQRKLAAKIRHLKQVIRYIDNLFV